MNRVRPEPDIASIRAALGLLFSEAEADRLTRLAERDKPEDRLRRLAGRAMFRLRVDRWRQRIRRRRPAAGDRPPLGPPSGLTARQSLALTLHLGLNLPASELADLLHEPVDAIGEDLYQARARLSESSLAACPDFIPALGRYRDPSLEINQRVTLLRHAADCADCRKTLDGFQRIDEELTERLDAARSITSTALPKPTVRDRLTTSPRLWLGFAAVLAVVVIALAGAGISRVVGTRQQPVPLLASAESRTSSPPGWLLTADPNVGAIQAIDLADGRSREVSSGNGSPGSSFTVAALSPNRQLIASWGPRYAPTGPASQVPLVVSRLDGSGVFQHVWALPNAPGLAGWLDNTHVLMIGAEQAGGSNSNDWTSSLISVDITNGDMRTLTSTKGVINNAVPSPDGTLIAISYGGYASTQSAKAAATVELRPIRAGALGPPIATIQRIANGSPAIQPVWSPDSRHLYLSRIDDPGAPVLSSQGGSFHLSHGSIIAVDRSGKVTTVVDPPGQLATAAPIVVLPDSRQLVYEIDDLSDLRSNIVTASIWESALPSGAAPKQLLKRVMPASATAFNDPSGSNQALLQIVEPSYLVNAAENRSANGNVDWPVVYAVNADGSTTAIATSPALASGALLGWVPVGALPPVADEAADPIDLGRVTPASVPDFDGSIDSASIVSPDGDVVVAHNPRMGVGGLLALDRRSGDSQSYSQDLGGPAWFGQTGNVLIAATLPDKYLPSRLVWLSTSASRSGQGYDGVGVDPANLASSRSLSYAHPVVTPNGLATAFFVIDSGSHQATLWIASLDHAPRQVDQWTYGSKPAGDLPLVAVWVNDTTLLYATPGRWKSGLPQDPRLVRLTLEPDGSTQQETLVTFHLAGLDRGLALAGIAMSPDGRALAVRLRHFTHNDARSGVQDAMRLMPASDLRQQLEVDRAAPGSGLSWSPDGRWLAFDLKGDIGVVAWNGTTMHYIDTSGSAGAPLWVGGNELWFTTRRDGQPVNRRMIFS